MCALGGADGEGCMAIVREVGRGWNYPGPHTQHKQFETREFGMTKDLFIELIRMLNPDPDDNPEYLRGQIELAADVLGDGDDSEALMEEIEAAVREDIYKGVTA